MNEGWLRQEWVHAHEEDTGETRVFRPASWPLPPSRGRRRLDLRGEGVVHASRPGADDRGVTEDGTWTRQGDTVTLHRDPAGAAHPPEQLVIVSLDPDRLVLRRS